MFSASGLRSSLSPAMDPLQKKARSFVTGPSLLKVTHLSWPLWGVCEGVVNRYGFLHICVGHEHPSVSAVQMAPREFLI